MKVYVTKSKIDTLVDTINTKFEDTTSKSLDELHEALEKRKEPVQSLKKFLECGGRLRYLTVSTIPTGMFQKSDFAKVTDMSYMFYNCSSLTTIPELDTSNVTNMNSMFRYCSSLTTIPELDTSNVTDMSYMFSNCSKLTTIPELDTSNVTNMGFMFYNCSKLTSIPELDTSNVTDMRYMFYNCSSLTTIPELDTSKVTNMNSMFSDCSSLTTIPELDTSNVTDMSYMFSNCSKLTSIKMKNMKVNFSINNSTLLDREALLVILNNLSTVTSTRTLTMGSTLLAKLTDEDKTIATNKGWTLA